MQAVQQTGTLACWRHASVHAPGCTPAAWHPAGWPFGAMHMTGCTPAAQQHTAPHFQPESRSGSAAAAAPAVLLDVACLQRMHQIPANGRLQLPASRLSIGALLTSKVKHNLHLCCEETRSWMQADAGVCRRQCELSGSSLREQCGYTVHAKAHTRLDCHG